MTRLQVPGHREEEDKMLTNLFMEAEIGLAVELSVVRSGDEPARVCQNFLAEINAEKYVQAGMMADAGDEALQLTRRHFFIMFQKRV